MKASHVLVGIFGVTAAAFAALWYQTRLEMGTLRTELSVANEAHLQSETARALAEKQLKELAAQVAVAESRRRAKAELNASAKQVAGGTAGTAANGDQPTARPGPSEGKAWLATATDPSAIRGQSAKVRLQMEKRYGEFIQKIGLPPEKAEQLMSLLMDKRQASADLMVASLQQDSALPSDPLTFAKMVAMTNQETEDEIHQLLGDDAYTQYIDWDRGVGQSSSIQRLQAALKTDAKLNSDQVTQLQQVLEEQHAGHITPKVLTAVQNAKFLSGTQQQALQDLFEAQQAAQQRRRSPASGAEPHN